MTPGLAAALTGALFNGCLHLRNRVAVFVAFSDESGTGDPEGEFLFGGYLAPCRKWPRFAKAWTERVLNAPPPIPYLHMAEIRGNKFKTKHGLANLDVANKVDEAVRVIRSSGYLSAHIGTVKRSMFHGVLQESLTKAGVSLSVGVNEPDYPCSFFYAGMILDHVYHSHSDASRVDFVVSRKVKVTHHVRKFKDELKGFLEPDYPDVASLIGDLIPASMEDRVPLQAADVCCGTSNVTMPGPPTAQTSGILRY